MTGITPAPVGASRFATSQHKMSVIVGLVGRNSGTMTLSVSENGMRYLAGLLIGEEPEAITEEAVDGMMELGNMVAGCIKESLLKTHYEVVSISLPSLIVGNSFNVMYARGMATVSVQFELDAFGVMEVHDRFFTCTVSLLRGSGM